MPLELTSTAFGEGDRIPERYTCDGEDISPPLSWNGISADTVSFVLIMDDPDASVGTWVHWVVFNIPSTSKGLSENYPGVSELPEGAKHGINSWQRIGYGGPCPPGGMHRYFFKLYALDCRLDLEAGSPSSEVTGAMQSHIIAQTHLMGTYSRVR